MIESIRPLLPDGPSPPHLGWPYAKYGIGRPACLGIPTSTDAGYVVLRTTLNHLAPDPGRHRIAHGRGRCKDAVHLLWGADRDQSGHGGDADRRDAGPHSQLAVDASQVGRDRTLPYAEAYGDLPGRQTLG